MLVFSRALPIFGLVGGLRVVMGSAVGLDGEGVGWVTWLGALVDLSSSSSLSCSASSCWSRVSIEHHRCCVQRESSHAPVDWRSSGFGAPMVLLGASVMGMRCQDTGS
jgi:hypothetical protein